MLTIWLCILFLLRNLTTSLGQPADPGAPPHNSQLEDPDSTDTFGLDLDDDDGVNIYEDYNNAPDSMEFHDPEVDDDDNFANLLRDFIDAPDGMETHGLELDDDDWANPFMGYYKAPQPDPRFYQRSQANEAEQGPRQNSAQDHSKSTQEELDIYKPSDEQGEASEGLLRDKRQGEWEAVEMETLETKQPPWAKMNPAEREARELLAKWAATSEQRRETEEGHASQEAPEAPGALEVREARKIIKKFEDRREKRRQYQQQYQVRYGADSQRRELRNEKRLQAWRDRKARETPQQTAARKAKRRMYDAERRALKKGQEMGGQNQGEGEAGPSQQRQETQNEWNWNTRNLNEAYGPVHNPQQAQEQREEEAGPSQQGQESLEERRARMQREEAKAQRWEKIAARMARQAARKWYAEHGLDP